MSKIENKLKEYRKLGSESKPFSARFFNIENKYEELQQVERILKKHGIIQ
jgi:hypothetical protein